jgi:hypothetical protein
LQGICIVKATGPGPIGLAVANTVVANAGPDPEAGSTPQLRASRKNP